MQGRRIEDEETQEYLWLTVTDAANYLDVSEATVRAWMSEGLLSWQKIGGQVRVLQSRLDQMLRNATTRARVEHAAGRCICCGSRRLHEGRLSAPARLQFRPDHTRFWTMEEAGVSTEARVCAVCGFVQIHADTAKLARLVPDGRAAEPMFFDVGPTDVAASDPDLNEVAHDDPSMARGL